MDVVPHNPREFAAQMSRRQLGPIGLSWVKSHAATVNVQGGHVGAWSALAGDAFLLTTQETGTCIGRYCGREGVTRPGDMVLFDASLSLPWNVINPGLMST